MDASAAADTEIVRRIEDGDVRSAGAMLVARFADEVYGLCRAMVRDAVVAEDLSQDVFGRAFAALREFRGEASPRTWILRIARNRCIDHLRATKQQIHEDRDPDAELDDAPLAIDAILHRADVEAALATLTESERALVVLRFGHGLEYPELAGAFGLKEGAVRMRLSRAVAKMREAVERQAAQVLTGARRRMGPADEEAAAVPPAVLSAPMPRAAAAPPPRGFGAPPSPARATPAAAQAAPVSPLAWHVPHALRVRLTSMIDALA